MNTNCAEKSSFLMIPEFPSIPSILLDKILRREVIVFVGNGVSRLGKLPSWLELAHSFLENWWGQKQKQLDFDTYQHFKREKTDPVELLTLCESALGRKVMHSNLSVNLLRAMKDEDKKFLCQIYGYIRDFRAGYVTTNYDYFLEETPLTDDELGSQEANYLQKLQMPKIPIRLQRVGLEDNLGIHTDKIVYLHGKLARDNEEEPLGYSTVLTLGDYLRHYRNGGRGRVFLEKIEQKTFLFIGLGLKEFEIIQHIHPPINGFGTHFILLGLHNCEACVLEHYKRYYNTLHIELIPYNISFKGYKQLNYVLEEWSGQIRRARLKAYKQLCRGQEIESNLQNIKEFNHASLE